MDIDRSGRRKDFLREAVKIECAVNKLLAEHQSRDADKSDAREVEKAARKLERMRTEAREIRQWLHDHPADRRGAGKASVLSNWTDNESAKMAIYKGVVQGYCGVVAVDTRHQIIIEAQAHGTGSEQALLPGIVDALVPHLKTDTVLVADAGNHSGANLKRLEAQHIEAYIADNGYRQRDARYRGQETHKSKEDTLRDKRPKAHQSALFRPREFQVASEFSQCVCPAGQSLYRNGANCNIGGKRAVKFTGAKSACGTCPKRAQCLRHRERTPVRQVAIFVGRHGTAEETTADRMRRRIDSPQGRERITQRFATLEPVFGNLRHNKALKRFTLRGWAKVDGQWKLYCLVQNIEKLANSGYGGR